MVRGLAGRLHARLPKGCGIEIADLIQAGNVGLLKATGAFEEGYGAPLACYAKFRIRGEMLDMVRRSAEREKGGTPNGTPGQEGAELDASVSNASANSPQSSLLRQQRSAIIWEEIQKLPRRDQAVIRLRYSREMTLREIGDELRVNESRACQLHQSALTRLKRALARRGVKDFSHL
jgi:RNA polymerase sigma factor for flagellar operon FliA